MYTINGKAGIMYVNMSRYQHHGIKSETARFSFLADPGMFVSFLTPEFFVRNVSVIYNRTKQNPETLEYADDIFDWAARMRTTGS